MKKSVHSIQQIVIVVVFIMIILVGLLIDKAPNLSSFPMKSMKTDNVPSLDANNIVPQDLLVQLQEGMTKEDADTILQEIGLTYMYEGISRPSIEAKILFSSFRDVLKQISNNSLVDEAKYTDIAKENIRVYFKLGTKGFDINLFSLKFGLIRKPVFSRFNPEIRVKAPVGREDYYLQLLKNNPKVKNVSRVYVVSL